MFVTDAAEQVDAVIEAVRSAVVAERAVLEIILAVVLTRGHVLLEGVPGTGQTLLARSVVTGLGLKFSRIQFTPDLMPSDITGSYVFEEGSGESHLTAGPVFVNIVLADEISRAPANRPSSSSQSCS